MDWTLEVLALPAGDIDRAVAFYRGQACFHLDHDTRNELMHAAQRHEVDRGSALR